MRALAVFTLILLAAGCVTPSSSVTPASAAKTVPAGWWEKAIPSTLTDPKHNHSLRADHAGLTTPNFEVLGWDPLTTQTYGTTLEGMGCGGAVTRQDGRKLAVVQSISTDVSFVVADITDAAHPKMLGEYYMPNAVVWDADITADGQHVLVGAYPYMLLGQKVPVLPVGGVPTPAKDLPLKIYYRDACTGKTSDVSPINYLPFGPGIVMVGIEDPSNPQFEDWVSQPAIGPHSVGSQEIDGHVYATASITNFGQEISYYTIFEIQNNRLVPRNVIETPGHPGIPIVQWQNGHTDIYLYKHPVTNQLLGLLANWDGMYIFDLSGQVPQQLSSWFDAGNLHTTYPFPKMINGKVYMMAGQEVGEDPILPSGWVYILDITDPAKPTEVGRWTLPVKPKWDERGLQFSPHYVAIQNDTLFVANYHGGLWAVDITNLSQPQAVGIFVPDRDSPTGFGKQKSFGPSIEDVIVDQQTGLITTWDNSGGVYTLKFHPETPVVKAPAWPGSVPGGKK